MTLFSRKALLAAIAIACACILGLMSLIPEFIGERAAAPTSGALPGSGGTTQDVAISDSNHEDARHGALSEVTPGSEVSGQAPAEDQSAPDATKEVLTNFANEALFGRLQINAVLDHALALATLPIEQRPNLDYEDSDSIAYQLEGLPTGVEGHMLVGLQPYATEDGRTHRYLQMDINIPSTEPEYLDGAMRDGPRIHFSISYDVEDPKTPVRFALMLQRRVDLAASRKMGIDAYTGSYTQGALYGHDLLDTTKPISAQTFGIVNGNPQTGNEFSNAIALTGDLALDPALLSEILGKLQEKLSYVKGE